MTDCVSSVQGVPELHLKNFQLAQLIKFHMHGFFQYLRRHEMSTDYFTTKWFMTLYSCFLPVEVVIPIFDMFIYEGWRAVHRAGIAFLGNLEKPLMKMDMGEICCFFRDTIRKEQVIANFELFSQAARVRVNKILVNHVHLLLA